MGLDELVWWHDVPGGHSYIPLTDGMKSVVGLWNEQTAKMDQVRSFDPRGQVTTWSPQEVASCQERADCTSPGTSCAPCELELPQAHTSGPSPTRFGFGWHSAWRSPTTGLVQMRQRWYSPRLGQFLSHDPLEYLDSFNLFAFAGRDPVNGWDPMGLGRWGFAGEFWDGVKEGAAKEANRQTDEVGKTAESMKQAAKEVAQNWRFGLDGEVWGDALEEMGESIKDMAKGAIHGGVECVANPEACVTESGPAKRLKDMKDAYDRGDMRALGEKTGEAIVEGSVEVGAAAIGKGAGKVAKVVKTAAKNKKRRSKPKSEDELWEDHDKAKQREQEELDQQDKEWQNNDRNRSTPAGGEHSDHSLDQAKERGFSDKAVDEIVSDSTKNGRVIDQGHGKVRYEDGRGNYVIKAGDTVVTVANKKKSPKYKPKRNRKKK